MTIFFVVPKKKTSSSSIFVSFWLLLLTSASSSSTAGTTSHWSTSALTTKTSSRRTATARALPTSSYYSDSPIVASTSSPSLLQLQSRSSSSLLYHHSLTSSVLSASASAAATPAASNDNNIENEIGESKSNGKSNSKSDGISRNTVSSSSSSSTTTTPTKVQTGWLHNNNSSTSTNTATDPKNRNTSASSSSSIPSTAKQSSLTSSSTTTTTTAASATATATTPKVQTGWLHHTSSKTTAGASAGGGTMQARQRLDEAMQIRRDNHRIRTPGTIYAGGKDRLLLITEHTMAVPLIHPNLVKKQPTPPPANNNNGTTKEQQPQQQHQYIDIAFTIVEEVKDEESWRDVVSTFLSPQQRARAYKQHCQMVSAQHMLVYLQGGPGFGAPPPITGIDFTQSESGGGSWGTAALTKYKRIVLLDQRGTGASSPITKQSLQHTFPDLFILDATEKNRRSSSSRTTTPEMSSVQSNLMETEDVVTRIMDGTSHHPKDEVEKFTQAVKEVTDFMSYFRADSIVRDAELIKNVLMYTPSVDDTTDFDPANTASAYDPSVPNPWGCSLGQSFGGFCTMTYLSQIEYPPKITLLTGGIAPMLANSPADVYTSLWKKVKERNLRYYEMYPGDVSTVKAIVRHLLVLETKKLVPILPSGGQLTARRFLQLGMNLGGTPGIAFAALHQLLSKAFVQPVMIVHKSASSSSASSENKEDGSSINTMEFSRGFLKAIDQDQPFDEFPIYYWLHESIYADGSSHTTRNSNTNNNNNDGTNVATNWSANQAFEAKIMQHDENDGGMNEYDYRITSNEQIDLPVLFFGEMIFPWMVEDYAELRGIGCTALAHALATKQDWGPLYDADRMRTVLDKNTQRTNTTAGPNTDTTTVHNKKVHFVSRAAAAVYYEDMFVDFEECMKVTARGGPLEHCKVYITNEYQHSGIRNDGATIFNKLHGMATGSIQVPS